MRNYVSNRLSDLLAFFIPAINKNKPPNKNIDMTPLIEHVVDMVDPRIRVIGRYAKKLTPPLAHTWNYLENVADTIPQGITLNRTTGSSTDPRIKLIIDSHKQIRQLLDTAKPLIQNPLHNKSNRPDPVYLLLCMEKKEHNFLGTELAGEIIKRDVMKTRVTFINHRFLSAGYTTETAKLGFIKCALDGLLHKTHELIITSRGEHQQLIERKNQLRQQLHSKHTPSLPPVVNLFSTHNTPDATSPELRDIEQQLTKIRHQSESPEHHLLKIIETLHHPEHYLTVRKQSILMNNLGIKLYDEAIDNSVRIEYAEVGIEQALKHITLIIESTA